MLQEIIKIGGGPYLIFGVILALVLYVVRGVHGLHSRRSQHRKDFLELWADGRARDALWLQMAILYVFGKQLPTPVIRLALSRPDSSQSLSDLSEFWDLLDYDSDTQQVRWRQGEHALLAKRKFSQRLRLAGYFSCAGLAAISIFVSAFFGASSAVGWSYGLLAPILIWRAFLFLTREETFAVAVRVGDGWVKRINRAAQRARQRRLKSSV